MKPYKHESSFFELYSGAILFQSDKNSQIMGVETVVGMPKSQYFSRLLFRNHTTYDAQTSSGYICPVGRRTLNFVQFWEGHARRLLN